MIYGAAPDTCSFYFDSGVQRGRTRASHLDHRGFVSRLRLPRAANAECSAAKSVKNVQFLPVLCLFLLCGCHRGTMGPGTPDLSVDGFFVCQRCGCLSAINGGEPPAQIPAHSSKCP